MEKTEIMRHFIHEAVQQALVNSRLPYDHVIGGVLESEAEIVGRDACVRVLDADGGWVMLEARVEQLKADPRFRDSIPNPMKVARGDESGLRDNFDRIASGEVEVIK